MKYINILAHNGVQKFIALVLAVVVWFIATADDRALTERSYDVPLRVEDNSVSVNKRSYSQLPKTIKVVLSGAVQRLENITPEQIDALIDVSGLPEGAFQKRIELHVPSSTTVVRYSPMVVSGMIDANVNRSIYITPSAIETTDGALMRLLATPKLVNISGEKTRVDAVYRVVTVPTELLSGGSKEVALLAYDQAGKVLNDVTISPEKVLLKRIDVGTLPIKSVAVQLKLRDAGFEVNYSLKPESVRLLAKPEVLAALNEVSGTVAVQQGTYKAAVVFNLPEGVVALDTITAHMQVSPKP